MMTDDADIYTSHWRKAHGHRFFVSMLWGKSVDYAPQLYSFETDIELDAFLEGVEAGNGWMDYDFRVHTKGEKQKFTPEEFDLDPEDMAEYHKEEWDNYLEDKDANVL
jgi:hypothetical protein